MGATKEDRGMDRGEEKVQQSGRKRGKIQRRKQRTRTVKENENKWKKLK